MAKAKSRAADEAVKQIYVTQAGVYQGRIMTLRASHADAALADGWGADIAGSMPPNDSALMVSGEPPQSYVDWLVDAYTTEEPEPQPEPDPAPVLTSLTPDNAESGAVDDITMVVNGSGFTSSSVIVFNGHDEPTTLVSASKVSTGVKPSLFVVPAICPVEVRNTGGTSNSLMFEFTEAAP